MNTSAATQSSTIAWINDASQSRAIVLAIVTLILAFAFQGSRALWDPDEGRYVDIALQMIKSGNWWVPHLNEETAHLAKPPMTYWMIAASLKTFGRSEGAARLPYALAFLTTALIVFQLARDLHLRVPWAASLIWMTCAGSFVGFNVVSTDALLTMFEAAAMLALVRTGALFKDDACPRWVSVLWLVLGLAFLTKGPPALLPMLAAVVYLIRIRHKRALRQLFAPRGLCIFALVGLSWYASMIVIDPEALNYFVGSEVYGRIFADAHGRNGGALGALKVYVPTILIGSMPWGWLLIRKPVKAEWSALDRCREKFLWTWLLVPLSVFALSRSRLPLYLLPLFVPIALLCATRIRSMPLMPQREAWPLAVWIFVLLLTRVGASWLANSADAQSFSAEIAQVMHVMRTPATEVVFVDSKPRYGVAFYLNAEVVAVHLRGWAWEESESLCDATGGHASILWLVPDTDAAALEQQGSECGVRYRRIGEVRQRFAAFELLPVRGRRFRG
ncbi:MAG: ArnT family glycosyltransferase [Povalibacter sp.]